MMKKCVAVIMGIVISVLTVCSQEEFYVQAGNRQITLEESQEKAVRWILENQNENGSYGMDSTIKDTCTVMGMLADLGLDNTSQWLEIHKMENTDNDSLARLYCATGEETFLEKVGSPNTDGGYGITEWYESDIIDTMLVLEAYFRKNRTDGGCVEQVNSILHYLGQVQNADGGFAYLPGMESDGLLTVQTGAVLLACEKYGAGKINHSGIQDILLGIDQYEEEHTYTLDRKEDFEKCAYGALMLCLEGRVGDTETLRTQLYALQEGDGSFFGNLDCTVAAVRLMLAVEEYDKPHIQVTDIQTELSAYTVCIGYDTMVEISSIVYYECNYAFEGTWLVELLKNDSAEERYENDFTFDSGKPEVRFQTGMRIHPEPGDSYRIKVSLLMDDEILFDNTEDIYITELEINELVLEAEYIGDNRIELNWNNISNDYVRFGYRMFRSCDGGEWETKSAWGGSEKVRVLNIYPSSPYLGSWLTGKLTKEQIPAGKGLFEVSAVYLPTFNRNPEAYLFDKDGSYKYDVLYFGASDSNSGMDLSQTAYLATKAFTDSGRGVLFGHDTVTMGYGSQHPYFAQFAEQLGVKLKTDSGYVVSNKTKVVNSGVLTSYPWKIQGTLSIPQTHAYQQYTGGTTQATVWMELTNGGAYDKETGASADAYLFSRNQFAMIQTGHSNGQASDDERKVLANTLFYLKQLTEDTSVTDHDAYDLAAPGQCEVTDMTWMDGKLLVSVQAEDEGTGYSYYIQAQPQTDGGAQSVYESEVQEVLVASGIRGYVVCMNDTVGQCREEEFGEVSETENGILSLEVGGDSGTPHYLHIRAVDVAGNYGRERVYEIPERDNTDCLKSGYALFAREGVTVYGSDAEFEGDIYSGADIFMLSSLINVKGTCNAMGGIGLYASRVVCGDKTEGCVMSEFPQYKEKALRQLPGVSFMENTYTYSNPEIDITSICSFNGDITLSGSRLRGEGIIYAPNGTVTLNVADIDYHGSIIAGRIIIQGSRIHIDGQMEEEE